jgi:hypothetical protein
MQQSAIAFVESLGPIFMLAVAIFAFVLAICWLALPFALIGTKPLLRHLIAETRRTNELLEQVRTTPRRDYDPVQPLPATVTPEQSEARLRALGWVVENPRPSAWKLIAPNGTVLHAASPEALERIAREAPSA